MTEITSKLSTAPADRYKIERHLGEGGMATVYLAEGTNKPYVKAGAVVGIEGLREDRYHLIPYQSRRKLRPFDHIEAARGWLVEQASGEEGGGSG